MPLARGAPKTSLCVLFFFPDLSNKIDVMRWTTPPKKQQSSRVSIEVVRRSSRKETSEVSCGTQYSSEAALVLVVSRSNSVSTKLIEASVSATFPQRHLCKEETQLSQAKLLMQTSTNHTGLLPHSLGSGSEHLESIVW